MATTMVTEQGVTAARQKFLAAYQSLGKARAAGGNNTQQVTQALNACGSTLEAWKSLAQQWLDSSLEVVGRYKKTADSAKKDYEEKQSLTAQAVRNAASGREGADVGVRRQKEATAKRAYEKALSDLEAAKRLVEKAKVARQAAFAVRV